MIFQFILFYFIYFSEKIFNNLDLYNEDEEEQNNNDADGIGFSASSYAVLENENTSNIMIKRTVILMVIATIIVINTVIMKNMTMKGRILALLIKRMTSLNKKKIR